jgi:hypothetical protein
MVPRRPDTDPLDLHPYKLLNILNVAPRLVGQIIVALRTSCRLLPARQRLVVYLNLRQILS